MLRLANLAAAALVLCSSIFLETFFTWPQVDFLAVLRALPLALVAWLVTSALALPTAPLPFVVRLAMFLHDVMIVAVPVTFVLALGAIASDRPGLGVAIPVLFLGDGTRCDGCGQPRHPATVCTAAGLQLGRSREDTYFV